MTKYNICCCDKHNPNVLFDSIKIHISKELSEIHTVHLYFKLDAVDYFQYQCNLIIIYASSLKSIILSDDIRKKSRKIGAIYCIDDKLEASVYIKHTLSEFTKIQINDNFKKLQLINNVSYSDPELFDKIIMQIELIIALDKEFNSI